MQHRSARLWKTQFLVDRVPAHQAMLVGTGGKWKGLMACFCWFGLRKASNVCPTTKAETWDLPQTGSEILLATQSEATEQIGLTPFHDKPTWVTLIGHGLWD